MKKGCSPRKKYANGTGKTGVGPSNYIQNPAETLADYNIMLAKAEQEALSNPWLPIVGTLGAVGQSVVGSLRGPATSPMAHGVDKPTESANGNNNVQGDIEAEGGEMVETPTGQVQELQGPSHEQGGIPLEVNKDIPEGTKIYSDRLKVGDKTLAERKAARERQIANIEKTVSNGADLAVKNAAQRKMKAIEAEEQSDLQFQEQVNNMVEMTKTAMKAFGTGAAGVQKYANGGTVGPDPIPTLLNNYNQELIPTLANNYNDPFALEPVTHIKGVKFPELGLPKTDMTSLVDRATEIKDPFALTAGQDFADNNPLPLGIDQSMGTLPKDVGFKAQYPASKGLDLNLDLEKYAQGIPGVGDITKLVGNVMASTAGLKTAAEQRSTDIPFKNPHTDTGKAALKNIEEAQQLVEGQKASAIVKATAQSRGGKKGARGSARGINQSRAMDWLYDTALSQSVAEISANASQQATNLIGKKAEINMQSDVYRGEGEFKAAAANEGQKDAYYNALAQGRQDMAKGVQQTGKDINDMKQNKVIQNLLQQFGKYFTIDAKGNIAAKQTTK